MRAEQETFTARLRLAPDDWDMLRKYMREHGHRWTGSAVREILARALGVAARLDGVTVQAAGTEQRPNALHVHLTGPWLSALDEYRDQQMPGNARRGRAVSRIIAQALDRMEQLRRFDEARPR